MNGCEEVVCSGRRGMDISYAGAEKSHGGGSSKALSHLSQLEAPDSDDGRIGQGRLDLNRDMHQHYFVRFRERCWFGFK